MSSLPDSSKHSPSVLIVGGGVAGLAAATALAPQGFRVTLVESRQRLGGRASSFVDSASGQLLDNCQHVSMGCCTNLDHFCRTVGIDHFFESQPRLYFMTPDRRISCLAADYLPAPLHLARSFWTGHYLSFSEKCRVAYGLACLRGRRADDDPPFLHWLERHRQTPRTIARFWGLVLTSALNESPDRIGLRYARKVFVDGFLRSRRGFEIQLPTVPLGRLYGDELQQWLNAHGVTLRLGQAATAFSVKNNVVDHLQLRTGEALTADWYISAAPFDRILALLPDELVRAQPAFASLRELETSPITSVHIWYQRPVTSLPHIVLVDCLGQWVFNRGRTSTGEYYLQIVISAARQFRGLGHEEVQRRLVQEMSQLFPEVEPSALLRCRTVTEQTATFSAVPDVDRLRPSQESPVGNLLLAGDWTATGWPATMEGAVRSGYLAAEALCRRVGMDQRFVQPDL